MPQTEGLLVQKLHGLCSVGDWWLSCLTEGEVSGATTGFGKLNIMEPAAPKPAEQDEEKQEGRWTEEPVRVRKSDMHDSYVGYCHSMKIARPFASSAFWRKIRKLCPEFSETLPVVDGKRIPYAILPELNKCQRCFERAVGGSLEAFGNSEN